MLTEYSMDNFFDIITDPNGKLFIDNSSFRFNHFSSWIKSRYGEEYMIRSDTAQTPDLISYMKYGREDLWWVICLANGIINPFEEIKEGTIILLPKMSDVKEYINQYCDRTTNSTDKNEATIVLN